MSINDKTLKFRAAKSKGFTVFLISISLTYEINIGLDLIYM